MPGKYSITSDEQTAWQFGPIRASLEHRTSADDENITDFLSNITISRFRDHRNITAIAVLNSAATESIVGIDASFQGGATITVNGDTGYSFDTASPQCRLFLQDTTLEPIEIQGSTFVRETQEWTGQTPSWGNL